MKKISRRDFAQTTLAAATAAAVMPDAIAAPKAPPASPEVDARVQWIVAKYGARLDAAQRADIRRLIAGGQPDVEAMRKYPLENANAPALPFKVFRAKTSK
jgi:hypothetical protein